MLQAGERAQLIAAARLYYEEELTQAQVAQRLGVSRPSVSKMLTRAKKLGIVRIEICAGDEGESSLLERLRIRYGLEGGCVLPAGGNPWQQTARYLLSETAADITLGLGWGYALGEAVCRLERGRWYQQMGKVLPLIGEAHFPHKGYHPDALALLWAEASGRTAYSLGCSAFPASEEEREELESKSEFQQLSGLWQQLDVAVVAVSGYPGVPDEGTATRFGDSLSRQRAVGSFLSYYYNERGEFISGNNDFCLHIPMAQLLRCRKLIGIGLNAGGRALKGALATGLFTHLIIDEEQARSLL